MLLKNKKYHKGFSLLELMLALGVSAVIAMLSFEQIQKNTQATQAQITGQQLNTIATAMDNYIALRYNVISQQLNATGGPSDPGPRTCGGGVCSIDLLTLVNEGMLPAGYNSATTKTPFGSLYTLALHVSGFAPNYVVNGMVSTVSPWLNDPLSPVSASNQPRGDLIGLAMQAAGPDSGAVVTANTLNGMAGVWTENSTNYPGMFGSIGQLGERSGFGASVYSAYLPRNGALPMTGALSLGGNNILNANSVSTGDLQLNTAVAKGTACGSIGDVTRDVSGNLLSCVSGVWSAPSAGGTGLSGVLTPVKGMIASCSIWAGIYGGSAQGAFTAETQVNSSGQIWTRIYGGGYTGAFSGSGIGLFGAAIPWVDTGWVAGTDAETVAPTPGYLYVYAHSGATGVTGRKDYGGGVVEYTWINWYNPLHNSCSGTFPPI